MTPRGTDYDGVYEAILIVSVAIERVKELRDGREAELIKKANDLLEVLHCLEGVKHIQPIVYHDWLPDPDPKLTSQTAPWFPYGVLIIVEAKKPDGLDTYIRNIYEAAQKIHDPDILRLRPLGMNGR